MIDCDFSEILDGLATCIQFQSNNADTSSLDWSELQHLEWGGRTTTPLPLHTLQHTVETSSVCCSVCNGSGVVPNLAAGVRDLTAADTCQNTDKIPNFQISGVTPAQKRPMQHENSAFVAIKRKCSERQRIIKQRKKQSLQSQTTSLKAEQLVFEDSIPLADKSGDTEKPLDPLEVEESHLRTVKRSQARRLLADVGCNCRKSRCLKKYCVCYSAGLPCVQNCGCLDCSNTETKLTEVKVAGDKLQLSVSKCGTPQRENTRAVRGSIIQK